MPPTLLNSHTVNADAVWARTLLRTTLDGWLAGADDGRGLFHPYLDRQWRRIGVGPRTLVSQCRLIYTFARGHEAFGEGRFADAAQRGLAALETYFRAGQGLYRWAVTSAGAEADAALDSYGHAFVVLAQATAARVFGDAALSGRAFETWRAASATFTDAHGGLRWKADDPPGGGRSQNPLMHTFEALLALHAVDPSGEALAAARTALGFVRSLADFEGGRLAERHTADWRPQTGSDGSVVDLGHAFEWAFLLSEWGALTGDAEAVVQGARFLHTGIEIALDNDGGVRASCDAEGRVVSSLKGLWQQCEAVRALHRYAVRHKAPEARAALPRAVSFYRQHFVDDEYGGVFAAPAGLGAPACLDKGNAWKLDYHTAGMCLELMGSSTGEETLQ